jgi:hypothetical protein
VSNKQINYLTTEIQKYQVLSSDDHGPDAESAQLSSYHNFPGIGTAPSSNLYGFLVSLIPAAQHKKLKYYYYYYPGIKSNKACKTL